MKFPSLLTLFLLVGQLQAQTPSIICGNDLFSQMLATHHPDLKNAFDQTFEHARQFRAADRSPLTINVVVHIVWKDPAENLADSIIENQIQVLNEDFNRQNADTANLRDIFKPVAASADIHFNLAGIVRQQTNQLFEIDPLGTALLTELKKSSQGGSDAWNTSQYLNIWVCNIQPLTIFGFPVGQILGFAFPPNDLPNWPTQSGAPTQEEDGVVIDYRVFGRNNPNTIEIPGATGQFLVVKGRTPVHEIGHYLGMRHIWGDGGILGLPNNCAESDGVDDTPFANAQSNFDCDTDKNTCSQVEQFYNADMPDLVENYMDYSSEACMNMFTQGQVDIMRNVLQGPRSGLLNPVSTQQISATTALKLRVFPNPATHTVQLSFETREALEVQLQLVGLDGQQLRNIQVQLATPGLQQQAMDVQALPAGAYLLQVISKEGAAQQIINIIH